MTYSARRYMKKFEPCASTHEIPPLPLQETDLEPLEIGALLPGIPSGELLGPRRRLPLVSDLRLFERLPDGSSTGSTGKGGDGVRGEDEVTVSDGLTGNRRVGSVDQSLQNEMISVRYACLDGQDLSKGSRWTHPVVVDDLGDDGELAGRRSFVDQDDTSDLDETLEGRGGLSLRNGQGKSMVSTTTFLS